MKEEENKTYGRNTDAILMEEKGSEDTKMWNVDCVEERINFGIHIWMRKGKSGNEECNDRGYGKVEKRNDMRWAGNENDRCWREKLLQLRKCSWTVSEKKEADGIRKELINQNQKWIREWIKIISCFCGVTST